MQGVTSLPPFFPPSWSREAPRPKRHTAPAIAALSQSAIARGRDEIRNEKKAVMAISLLLFPFFFCRLFLVASRAAGRLARGCDGWAAVDATSAAPNATRSAASGYRRANKTRPSIRPFQGRIWAQWHRLMRFRSDTCHVGANPVNRRRIVAVAIDSTI